MDVSVIVPAHNEEGNLERLVSQVISALNTTNFNKDYEIFLVNDNSTDRTPEICDVLVAKHSTVKCLHRIDNPGFGAAVKAGFQRARGDILVPFMGDLSDDPADIPLLVRAIENGDDVAYGSRFTDDGSVKGYPPLKLLYNRTYNNVIRLLFGIRAKDVTNAFTAYRREVIEEIAIENIDSESFDITAELPLRAHILGFSSTEVPVSWRSREAGVSKLNATRKGPLYLKRLLHMFIRGNVTGLRDLFGAVTTGNPFQILGAIVLAIVILVGLFSFSGSGEVFGILANANVAWLGFAALGYFASFVFRTWRYRVLLRTAGHLASRGDVFRCIVTGWFVNFLLPARAGDAARGLALKTTANVPFGVATGLLVIERALDMLVLGGTLFVVVSVLVPLPQANLLAVGALCLGMLMASSLLLLYYFDSHVTAFLESWKGDITESIDLLNESLERVAHNPYALLLAGGLTFPVWAFEISTIYFSAHAVGLQLLPVETVTTAIASFVSQAVPVTPAGIGTYEATIVATLSLYDVSAGIATALALVDHFIRAAVIYVIGAICTVHIGFRSRVYFRQQSPAEDRTETPIAEENT